MTESTGDGLQIMTNKQPYETCLLGPRNAGLAQDTVTLNVSRETGMTPLIITFLQVQPLQALSEIVETRAPHAEPGPRRRESCCSGKRFPSGILAYLLFSRKIPENGPFLHPSLPLCRQTDRQTFPKQRCPTALGSHTTPGERSPHGAQQLFQRLEENFLLMLALLYSRAALYRRNPALCFLNFRAVTAWKSYVFRKCPARESQRASPEPSSAEDRRPAHPASLIPPYKIPEQFTQQVHSGV